ncbi:MAG TPA: glycosyltransferase family 2 protein [Capillimicrobium sp.]|nr:glycosyltransferase family 2 protein [Capillimicrobium sp.]
MPRLPNAQLRLGAVVVSYNSADVLPGALRALDASAQRAADRLTLPVPVVIVDNGSPSAGAVDAAGPLSALDVRVEHVGENLGFSRGVNHGLTVLPALDAVLLLNPDTVLDAAALGHMVDAMRSTGAALVGPLLVDETGAPHGASERPFHSLRRELQRQLAPCTIRTRPAGAEALATGRARALTGACLLVEAAFLNSVGGLDDEIAMYLEDIELAWQAHDAGRPVVLCPDARCYHDLGGSSEGANFESSDALHLTLLAARVEFVRRRVGGAGALSMRALFALGAVLRIVASALLRSRRRIQRHVTVLRWAISSGRAPAWPPA